MTLVPFALEQVDRRLGAVRTARFLRRSNIWSDYGKLNLALAFLLAVCAVIMPRGMIKATAICCEFYAVGASAVPYRPLGACPAIDAVGQTASLVLTVLVPLVLLVLSRAAPTTVGGSTALARFVGQDGGTFAIRRPAGAVRRADDRSRGWARHW